MFTEAHTLLSEDTWEKGPNIKNPVQRTNKQSIPEKGNSLEPLVENIYREDRAQAAKVVAARKNGSLSYCVNSEEARRGGETIIAERNEDFMLLEKTVGNFPEIKSF